MPRFKKFLALLLSVLFVALTMSACGETQPTDAPTDTTEQTELPQGSRTVYVNEYMTKNTYTLYDKAGNYYDWVELYNPGSSAVKLSGMWLSDKQDDAKRWQIPEDVTLEAGACLVIYLSGQDKYENGELHANFKLGSDDPCIALFDQKEALVDSLPVVALDENVSYGKSQDNPDNNVYFALATPGKANTSTGFTELAATQTPTARGVVISEVSAAYARGNKNKTQYDWVELHNVSDKPVNLQGYGLSKKLGGTKALKFGDITLPAGGYLTVEAAGKDGEQAEDDGTLNPIDDPDDLLAPFQIDANGDSLFLTNADSQVVDFFETGKLRIGVTSGRTDSLSREYYSTPTKGSANKAGKTGYNPKPEFSKAGGNVNAGETVELIVPEGCKVHYTTDGSAPTAQSKLYTAPITVNQTVTIRAAAFSDDALPSDSVSASFLVGQPHKVPVVFLSGNPDDLFGNQNGILANGPGYRDPFPYTGANFWKDWERIVSVEYYVDGEKALEFNAGANVFGQYSRAYDQKSIALHLRGDYGASSVTYPFWDGNKYTTVTDFVLRAGGQDQKKFRFRDAFCRETMEGYSDIASMDWQPVALYINGAYWGLYSIREKINENYFATHEGADPDSMEIIKGNRRPLSGTNDRYLALVDYVKTHSLTVKENYDYVCSQVDIDNFIDYLIVEIFFCNGDTGNKKCYRDYSEGSKWRWVMFDMDMSMYGESLWKNYDSFALMFDPEGHGSGKGFSTALQCALIKNNDFKQRFIERYIELLNTAFMPEHMLKVVDDIVAKVDPEIARNAQRWEAPTYDTWQSRVRELKNIINGRRDIAIAQLDAHLGLSQAQRSKLKEVNTNA